MSNSIEYCPVGFDCKNKFFGFLKKKTTFIKATVLKLNHENLILQRSVLTFGEIEMPKHLNSKQPLKNM